MIKKARAYLNEKAVPILAAASLILAVFTFSAGYTMGGIDWEMKYLAMRQACAEELVNLRFEYQAKFNTLQKLVDKYLNRGRSVPMVPEPEHTRIEI